ncbi:MAG: HD domain-containing protein [Intrasporangium sp.]|uniref:HD domain-containing protein n=1 Tax=Intrasporangium sp. TaxID=1925024 RepID=UPI00264A3638|nr:HD domain-containing protein [Intrasporangium sp.]MDN5795874.1 HD domain-containing protein [Intrasporangium sp.]
MADPRLAPAIELASKYLAGIEPRWSHVQAVGRTAETICAAHGITIDLAAAAWLHDIGYAPQMAETGFHPLDGARFLASIGATNLVVSLVAHHSGATFEADERGLAGELAEYPEPPDEISDVLVLIDMTTSPDGHRVSVDDRLTEILTRYPEDDPVHRAIVRSSDSLRQAAARAAHRLGLADVRGIPVL